MNASAGRLTSRPSQTTAASLAPGVHALDRLPATALVVPEQLAEPAPLLVFFHGAGGSAEDSLRRVQEQTVAAGALLLAPSSAGATWDLLTGGLGRDVAALDAALEQVFAAYAVGRVAFGGFSDGASYALSLGLANGGLAGALLAFSPGFAAPPTQEGVPRVWLSHGITDTVLPIDRCGRRVAGLLRDAGYDVTYEEFAGGHVVPPHLLDAALSWWLG